MPFKRKIDEPTQSDATILVKLEDLINMALGPVDKNTVDFKLLQTILHILARQMRLLETGVELRAQEARESSPDKRKSPRKKAKEGSTDESSSPTRKDKHGKDKEDKGKADKSGKGGKEKEATEEKGKVKGDKDSEKTGKEKGKDTAKDGREKVKDDKTAKEKHGKKDKTDKEDTEKGKLGGITVKEKKRGKDKVLVVETDVPSGVDSKTKVGSIEVVTQAQLGLLEAAVNELKAIAGPIPAPELPDNEKLRTDLVKGSASLTDTMQAMQVTARVKAAEEAIGRMAGLLTALAAAGALPDELLSKFGGRLDAGAELAADSASTKPASTPRKSVAIDTTSTRLTSPTRSEKSRKSLAGKAAKSATSAVSQVGSMMSRPSLASKQSAVSVVPPVTHPEMDEALEALKEDLLKNLNNLTTKSTAAADSALNTAKTVSERLDVALKLGARITQLNSLVTDYAEQLNGFDAGLATQMTSFQEQMVQMRSDLKAGLTQMEQANNNAEGAAIVELNERYEGLVAELDHTSFNHQGLTIFQKQLSDGLHGLVECVEALREEKADRDEVVDGLRDKADITRLAGLLSEEDFAVARGEIDSRLEVCYEKFKKQEAVWMVALNDLKRFAETKAEIMMLLGFKEEAQDQIKELRDLLNRLTVILGEPKAAILTRKLAEGASCGVCLVPALMEPLDANFGAPPPLPALPLRRERPPTPSAPSPTSPPTPDTCLAEWKPPQPPDLRDHTCHRWVGGSHTLLSESVKREQAPPLHMTTVPTKKYTGYGNDGRLYMLEEELQPCIECNVFKSDVEPVDTVSAMTLQQEEGAGDRVEIRQTITSITLESPNVE